MTLIDANARNEAVRALQPLLGSAAARTFDELLFTRPWREVLPAEFWYRDGVIAALDVSKMRMLFEAFVGKIGVQHAATLMEFLPPIPWPVLFRHGYRPSDFRT
jgi:hypothetical protein